MTPAPNSLRSSSPRRGAGFTLIEFMIAVTLSLLVLAALTAAFVASSRSRTEIEKANEQIENGRFALQLLTDDLEMAGFYSHLDIDVAMSVEFPLESPTVKVAPCTTAVAAAGANNDLVDALPLHIQGYDLPNGDIDSDAELAALGLDCISDVNFDADILVVRRTATCVGGAGDCTVTIGAPYFQASLCATDLNSTTAANYYELELAADAGLGNLGRTRRNCATRAEGRQYLTHIYYVANNDCRNADCNGDGTVSAGESDGVPTLKRAELGNAANPGGFTIVPLARGIQDLQIEYGIDSNQDGAPDVFRADPDVYDPPGLTAGPFADCAAHAAECILNWRNTVAVRLNLLARNSSRSEEHTDTKIYALGRNDDGSHRCARDDDDDGTCEAFNDGFKRHVYQTSVRLTNPAGRR